VHSITDALVQLTELETLHGEWKTNRGVSTRATKQVFVETFPPVLVLQLKRFVYDAVGGTVKVWKKIGYPLILDIPEHVISPSQRGLESLRYRLFGGFSISKFSFKHLNFYMQLYIIMASQRLEVIILRMSSVKMAQPG
jgi:ubiquitin C-terminal hydrolase